MKNTFYRKGRQGTVFGVSPQAPQASCAPPLPQSPQFSGTRLKTRAPIFTDPDNLGWAWWSRSSVPALQPRSRRSLRVLRSAWSTKWFQASQVFKMRLSQNNKPQTKTKILSCLFFFFLSHTAQTCTMPQGPMSNPGTETNE